MGVADCAYAEAAASKAAPVMKPKSFAISCFLLICINAALLRWLPSFQRIRDRGRKLRPTFCFVH